MAAAVKTIKITVRTSTGKAFEVTIAQTETVSNLRNKLTAALKPPSGQELQLVFNNKVMSIGSLADYGVAETSQVLANFVAAGTGSNPLPATSTAAAPAASVGQKAGTIPNPLSPAPAATTVSGGAAAAAAAASGSGGALPAAGPAVPSKQKNLIGVAVVEKDVNNDLFAWTFPIIDADTLEIIRARSGLRDRVLVEPAFRYTKFRTQWIYSFHASVDSTAHPKVNGVALVLVSEIFNPSKFDVLCQLLLRVWQTNAYTVPPVLAAYLNVFTTGRVTVPASGSLGAATFLDSDYDNRRAYISPVRELFQIFGADAMLIWNAVLLKKRVFVYSDKLSDLLALVRSFPLLGGWHRQNWEILRPVMGLSEPELNDLSTAGVYVAGFTDPACAQQKALYDLYVDVPARSFTVGDHAKSDFVLTQFHRDLSDGFMAVCEKQNDQAVIKEIALKTKELLTNITSLKSKQSDGSSYITFEDLAARKLPANMDRFLYAVAAAEGMTKK